jgi:hypothetical protein
MNLSHHKAFEWSLKDKDMRLSENQRRKLAEHRRSCPTCQQETTLAQRLSQSLPAYLSTPELRSQPLALRRVHRLRGLRSFTQTLAWGATALLLVLILRWTFINLAPTELVSFPQESSNLAGAPLVQPVEQPLEPQENKDGAPTGSEGLWLTLGNSIWIVLYFVGILLPLGLGLMGILLGIRRAHTFWLGVLLGSFVLSSGFAFLSIDVNSGSAIPLLLAIPFIVMSISLLAVHLWETRALWGWLTWLGIGLLIVAILVVLFSPMYTTYKQEVFDRSGFLVVLVIGLVPAALWKSQELKGRWRWIYAGLLGLSLLGAAGTYLSFTLLNVGILGSVVERLRVGEVLYCFTGIALAGRLLEGQLFEADRLPPMRRLLNLTLLALLFLSLYAVIRSEAVRNSLREDPAMGTILLWCAAWTAVLAAVSQTWKRKGRRLWAYSGLIALFAVLLSPAMLVPKELPYRLTEQSAARLEGAIQEYHAEQGVYPASLGVLVPRYLWLIPEPVTYHTQVWCYDGGAGYFRLGYYDSENYRYGDFQSLFVKEFASAGTPPESEIPCGVRGP